MSDIYILLQIYRKGLLSGSFIVPFSGGWLLYFLSVDEVVFKGIFRTLPPWNLPIILMTSPFTCHVKLLFLKVSFLVEGQESCVHCELIFLT